MKLLVSAASRHGSTAEIAAEIARALAAAGLAADVREPAEVRSLDGYDGVVLGSAVYMGRWLEPARRLATERAADLRTIPVWLFSSGPTGDPLMPKEEPIDAGQIVELIGAREHRVFGGVIHRRLLGLTEKAVVTMVRARDGDFRQWDEIGAWTTQIAVTLQRAGAPSAARPTAR